MHQSGSCVNILKTGSSTSWLQTGSSVSWLQTGSSVRLPQSECRQNSGETHYHNGPLRC
jgi:hypothetical protein